MQGRESAFIEQHPSPQGQQLAFQPLRRKFSHCSPWGAGHFLTCSFLSCLIGPFGPHWAFQFVLYFATSCPYWVWFCLNKSLGLDVIFLSGGVCMCVCFLTFFLPHFYIIKRRFIWFSISISCPKNTEHIYFNDFYEI